MALEENKGLVNRFAKAWEKGDMDEMDRIIADDFVFLKDVGHFLAQGQFLDGVESHEDDGLHDIQNFHLRGIVGGVGQEKDPGRERGVDFDALLQILGRGVRVADHADDTAHDTFDGDDVTVFELVENILHLRGQTFFSHHYKPLCPKK